MTFSRAASAAVGWLTGFGRLDTALAEQEVRQRLHPTEVGRVDHPPPVATFLHQPSRFQAGEVEVATRRRKSGPITDLARREALGPDPYQQAKQLEPAPVGEGIEHIYSVHLLHVSRIVET
jgi:hypothetical protein